MKKIAFLISLSIPLCKVIFSQNNPSTKVHATNFVLSGILIFQIFLLLTRVSIHGIYRVFAILIKVPT
jgi:hypothetical protein